MGRDAPCNIESKTMLQNCWVSCDHDFFHSIRSRLAGARYVTHSALSVNGNTQVLLAMSKLDGVPLDQWRLGRNGQLDMPGMVTMVIWRFPEGYRCSSSIVFMGFSGIFHCKPTSYWGTPMTSWKPPYAPDDRDSGCWRSKSGRG